MRNDPRKKLRIALVAPSLRALGGQSVQADRLVHAFASDCDVEVTLIPNDPDTALRGVRYLRTFFSSLRYWLALVRSARRNEIFVVSSAAMSGYVIATIPALLIGRLFGKKTILNYHSGDLEDHIRKWPRTALPTMRRFDDIVVPSLFLAGVFERHGLRAAVVSNFVEAESFPFRERAELEPVFLSNRNLEASYNVGDVLRAFRTISSEVPAARLIVAGYGSGESELKALAADLGLRNVEFTGRVDQAEMRELYGRADIYLNASVVDNMPLSIIEAFSSGLPVVSYATGGIPCIVDDRRTGLLVETGDHQALAAKALELLGDPGLARTLAANARSEALRYSPEKVKEDWKACFFGHSSRAAED